MVGASNDFWDSRARPDVGLHAVMTRRWTEAQCLAVHQEMQSVIVGAVRDSGADITIWLDLGCGIGRFLGLPFTVGPAVAGVLGVDPSYEMCRRAVCDRRQDPRGRVVQATGSRLPIADSTVSCALSVAVLQHLDLSTLNRTGAEVNRVLAPGGTLVMLEGTRDETHGDKAAAGTTGTTLYSIGQFRDALGAGLSLTRSASATFISDRYTCLVWRKQS